MTLWLFDGDTGQAVPVSPELAEGLAASLLGDLTAGEISGMLAERALDLLNRAHRVSDALTDIAPETQDRDDGGAMGCQDLVDLREAAGRLGVSTSTVRRLSDDGSLPSVMVGGALRFDPPDIENYIRSQKRGA